MNRGSVYGIGAVSSVDQINHSAAPFSVPHFVASVPVAASAQTPYSQQTYRAPFILVFWQNDCIFLQHQLCASLCDTANCSQGDQVRLRSRDIGKSLRRCLTGSMLLFGLLCVVPFAVAPPQLALLLQQHHCCCCGCDIVADLLQPLLVLRHLV